MPIFQHPRPPPGLTSPTIVYTRPAGVNITTAPFPYSAIHFEDFVWGSIGPVPASFGGAVNTPIWVVNNVGGSGLQSVSFDTITDQGAFGSVSLNAGVNGDLVFLDRGGGIYGGLGVKFGDPVNNQPAIGAFRVKRVFNRSHLWGAGWLEQLGGGPGATAVGRDWLTDPVGGGEFTGTEGFIVRCDTANIYQGYAAGDLVCFTFTDSGTGNHNFKVCSAADMLTDTWHRIEMASTGSGSQSAFTLYYDGVAKGTVAIPGMINNQSSGLRFAAGLKCLQTGPITTILRFDYTYEEQGLVAPR